MVRDRVHTRQSHVSHGPRNRLRSYEPSSTHAMAMWGAGKGTHLVTRLASGFNRRQRLLDEAPPLDPCLCYATFASRNRGTAHLPPHEDQMPEHLPCYRAIAPDRGRGKHQTAGRYSDYWSWFYTDLILESIVGFIFTRMLSDRRFGALNVRTSPYRLTVPCGSEVFVSCDLIKSSTSSASN